jgi:hypothetical protein
MSARSTVSVAIVLPHEALLRAAWAAVAGTAREAATSAANMSTILGMAKAGLLTWWLRGGDGAFIDYASSLSAEQTNFLPHQAVRRLNCSS